MLTLLTSAMLVFATLPARALATPEDVASTHTYLLASYTALRATLTTWSSIEANIHKLDGRIRSECPQAGAGSPQSEEEQKLGYEVAGALWATGYHTESKSVEAFVKVVGRLRWSNPAVTRSARKFVTGLREMTALQVPDLCGDVRAWSAGGFKAVTASTAQYAKHVEGIEVNEIPERLLVPYVKPSDRGLLARVKRLARQYEETEISRGQADWNALLEVLDLNQ